MKIYEWLDEAKTNEDDQIKVIETRDLESITSVEELKRRIDECDMQIANLKEEKNKYIDELTAINADKTLNITVKDIPTKDVISIEK